MPTPDSDSKDCFSSWLHTAASLKKGDFPGNKVLPGFLTAPKSLGGKPVGTAWRVWVRGLFLRRRQYHLLFKERIPAGNKARLPGKPQHRHQDEEKASHHFRVAIEWHRKTRSRNWGIFVNVFTLLGILLCSELQHWLTVAPPWTDDCEVGRGLRWCQKMRH